MPVTYALALTNSITCSSARPERSPARSGGQSRRTSLGIDHNSQCDRKHFTFSGVPERSAQREVEGQTSGLITSLHVIESAHPFPVSLSRRRRRRVEGQSAEVPHVAPTGGPFDSGLATSPSPRDTGKMCGILRLALRLQARNEPFAQGHRYVVRDPEAWHSTRRLWRRFRVTGNMSAFGHIDRFDPRGPLPRCRRLAEVCGSTSRCALRAGPPGKGAGQPRRVSGRSFTCSRNAR